MPYIKKENRADLQGIVEQFRTVPVLNAGEVNYLISELARSYLKAHGLTYQHLNDLIGALEGAKLELYRRVAVPYEDLKLEENGDVYEA